MDGILLILLVGVLALGGRGCAYNEVTKDCKRQGSFYVGSTVYECKVKEKP